MIIKSRIHPINALIFPIFLVLFMSSLGYFICYLSFLDFNSGKVDSIFKTPIYGGIICFAVAFWTILYYLQSCKKIQISDQGIQFSNMFGSESIFWNDIKKIDLTGKSYIMMTPMESTSLLLKTGRKKNIVAAHYLNMPAIRLVLEQAFKQIQNHETVSLKQVENINNSETLGFVNIKEMKKYSGNHFFSFNGIMIYGWLVFVLFMFLNNYSAFSLRPLILIVTIMFAVFLGFFGYQLHYFYLDKDHLVIKNHVWPWRTKTYLLNEIKEVVFEIPYRQSISLRVITKGYESQLFPGGSLREKTWKALKKDIRVKEIKVRNEAFL